MIDVQEAAQNYLLCLSLEDRVLILRKILNLCIRFDNGKYYQGTKQWSPEWVEKFTQWHIGLLSKHQAKAVLKYYRKI